MYNCDAWIVFIEVINMPGQVLQRHMSASHHYCMDYRRGTFQTPYQTDNMSWQFAYALAWNDAPDTRRGPPKLDITLLESVHIQQVCSLIHLSRS